MLVKRTVQSAVARWNTVQSMTAIVAMSVDIHRTLAISITRSRRRERKMAIARYEIVLDYDRSIRIERIRGIDVEMIYNGSRLPEAIQELRKRMRQDMGG